jgi:hypothetical protein
MGGAVWERSGGALAAVFVTRDDSAWCEWARRVHAVARTAAGAPPLQCALAGARLIGTKGFESGHAR